MRLSIAKHISLFIFLFSLISFGQDRTRVHAKYTDKELVDTILYFKKKEHEDSCIYFNDLLIAKRIKAGERIEILAAHLLKAENLAHFNRIDQAFRLSLELEQRFCLDSTYTENCEQCRRLYINMMQFMRTMKSYREGLRYLDKVCESQRNAQYYFFKARLYSHLDNPDSALITTQYYIDQATEEKKIHELIYAYNNYGLVARHHELYELAIEAFSKGLYVADTSGQGGAKYDVIVGNIGSCYYHMGDQDKAYEYLTIDAIGSRKSNTLESYVNAVLLLAEIDVKRGDYVVARQRMDTIRNEYSHIMQRFHEISALKILSDSYRATGPADKYIEYSTEWAKLVELDYNEKIEMQRQLVAEYAANNLRQITVQMENEKELERLTHENQLQEEEKQRNMLYGGLGFLFILAGLIGRSYYRKRKDHKLISEQKKQVEKQQKSIVESITYAKRIQESILPANEAISKAFPSFAVYFEPKDIVSGDFYWHTVHDDYHFIVIGDCTGHGVPGGFMTMLGVTTLKEVILGAGRTEPERILQCLDENVVQLLSQHDFDSADDGMELAILRIDEKNKKVVFSGASINLYSVTDEVKIIPGTKRGIGGWSPNRARLAEFQAHEFNFDELGTVYLATDGVEDQFNGDTGMKFGRDQLMQHLVKSKTKDRLNGLVQALYDWKGTGKQTDDICAISLCFSKDK